MQFDACLKLKVVSIADVYEGYKFNIGIPVSIIDNSIGYTIKHISFVSVYQTSQTEYVIRIVAATLSSSGTVQSFASVKAGNISIYYL